MADDLKKTGEAPVRPSFGSKGSRMVTSLDLVERKSCGWTPHIWWGTDSFLKIFALTNPLIADWMDPIHSTLSIGQYAIFSGKGFTGFYELKIWLSWWVGMAPVPGWWKGVNFPNWPWFFCRKWWNQWVASPRLPGVSIDVTGGWRWISDVQFILKPWIPWGKMAPQQPLKPGMTRDDLVRYKNGRF